MYISNFLYKKLIIILKECGCIKPLKSKHKVKDLFLNHRLKERKGVIRKDKMRVSARQKTIIQNPQKTPYSFFHAWLVISVVPLPRCLHC